MYKNEKQILNIIKYTPPVFVLTISIIISVFLYIDKQSTLEKEKKQIKTNFIRSNKLKIKNDTHRLHDFIVETKKDTEKFLKENIKNRVYEAHRVASSIYNENKDIKSEQEIKQMIKNALRHIRFNQDRGYYFIYSMENYECILLPLAKKLEGTSFYNFKDGKGEYLTRKIVKQVKEEQEGFLTWSYHKPDDMTKQYKKIGFNKYFEPYNWFIGTGEYFVDFEKLVKKEVLNYTQKLSSDKNNYYMILDYNGEVLANNNKMDTLSEMTTSTKKELIHIAKTGSGYLSYKNDDNTANNTIKTSYSKGLKNWNWVITKIFYENDMSNLFIQKEKELNKKFNKNILYIFTVAIILTSILLAVSFYISRILNIKFNKYRKDIQNHIEENTKQNHLLSQQAKMAAMGEMLGNIAHQWRQPLSLITTAASGMKLQKDYETLDDDTFNDSIHNITNSAQYLSKTIDDFRNFFKTDKISKHSSILTVIEKTLKLTNAQLKINDINLKKELIEYEVYGVENELIQALINIINNSKDALITKDHSREISIKTYKNNNKGILEISDNGGGIDKKILDKVIEPYFTTKHQSQGTGIGLYMTDEIIKKHFKASMSIENKKYILNKDNYLGLQTKIVFNLE
ncbi:sensor histidine kinase [Arcobacter peruensis]|uniref:sensor histidine kinase n=1 Tax=Arcobacter peruensis TaxID=2320140 RepID=UPI000F0803B8|nr:cache domain-containing protein [Arcobacter peruensis]